MHIVTPTLRLSTKPTAVVLRAIRLQGPAFRDGLAESTGLSVSTVNRQVSALLEAGLIRERPDLAEPGAVGRPRLPLEINATEYLTLGIHIGYRATSITAHDLFHRVVGASQIPSPLRSDPVETLQIIAASARRFLTQWPGRTVLGAGVAVGGRVYDDGVVDNPRLDWEGVPVGETIATATGLPVAVAPHVEAMAAAELLLNPNPDGGSFLYFYVREAVGIAFTMDGSVYRPSAGPPVISRFPIGTTTYLDPHRTGQLETAVSDTGVVQAARSRKLTNGAGEVVSTVAEVHERAASGVDTAEAILTERAEVLGTAVGIVSDMFNPDHVILGGQAFTAAPQTLPVVATAARRASVVGKRDIRVAQPSAAGSNTRTVTVQQQAAGAVSLDLLYGDPLAAIELARSE